MSISLSFRSLRSLLRRGGAFVSGGALLILGVAIGLTLSSFSSWMPMKHAEGAAPQKPVIQGVVQSEQGFVAIAKAATPSVVNISTTRIVKTTDGPHSPFMDDPFFRQFFGDQFHRNFGTPRERKEQSLGSGVIVDPKGYIITNNHVIEKADEIKVFLGNKKEYKGKVIGTDPKTDIAVIKINADDLPAVTWGDSDHLQVGEYVLAIGNPFGLNQTVTMGIVSAVGRANVGIADYEDFIQTDAAINPGNSGGALVNSRGELIGINTAIFTRSGGYMGIGFAVPANMARKVMDSLISKGKVVRGWLGVSIQDLNPDLAQQFGDKNLKGSLVADVLKDSPAEKAGLKRGDIITGYEGKPIEDTIQLRNMVANTPVGKTVSIRVVRDKKEMNLKVAIAELPKDAEKLKGSPEESYQPEEAGVLSGVQVQNLTDDILKDLDLPAGTRGVVVSDIESGSAAEDTGLRQGDVIQEINRKPVGNVDDYRKIVSKLGKSSPVLLLINRQGSTIFFTLNPE